MNEFRKLSAILWKRNKIWFVMIIALVLLTQSFVVNNQLRTYEYSILNHIGTIEIISKNNPEDILKDSEDKYKDFHIEVEIFKKDLKEEYPKKLPEDYLTNIDYKFRRLAEEYGYKSIEDYNNKSAVRNWRYEESESINDVVYDELYFYDSNVNSKVFRNDEHIKLNITKELFNVDFGMILVILIFVFLLTSLEHLTPYYEFTEMFPWSKSKTYYSKVIFVSLLSLGLFFIADLLKYGIWSTSFYGNLIGLNGILESALSGMLAVLGYVFIFTALGTVSGNILGNIGMLIIGFGGIRLWIYNIRAISYLIFGELSNTFWLFRFENWFNRLPQYLQVFFSPINSMFIFNSGLRKENNLAIFSLGLIFFAIGWFWANRNKSERSGMLLMRKNVSLYAQALAVITTANSIYLLMRSVAGNRILGLAVFIVGFMLSYLFYKKMFNIRIGI